MAAGLSHCFVCKQYLSSLSGVYYVRCLKRFQSKLWLLLLLLSSDDDDVDDDGDDNDDDDSDDDDDDDDDDVDDGDDDDDDDHDDDDDDDDDDDHVIKIFKLLIKRDALTSPRNKIDAKIKKKNFRF